MELKTLLDNWHLYNVRWAWISVVFDDSAKKGLCACPQTKSQLRMASRYLDLFYRVSIHKNNGLIGFKNGPTEWVLKTRNSLIGSKKGTSWMGSQKWKMKDNYCCPSCQKEGPVECVLKKGMIMDNNYLACTRTNWIGSDKRLDSQKKGPVERD